MFALPPESGRSLCLSVEDWGHASRPRTAGIILWRKILAREPRAIADGRKRKRWTTPLPEVVPTLGF